MKVSIHSIKSTLFSGEAEKLLAHTPQGQITILDNHIPLITKLIGPAVVAVDRAGQTQDIPLNSGILEVRPESEVVILAQV